MILCDTNILIEFYKNNPTITANLHAIGSGNLAVSAVTVAELYANDGCPISDRATQIHARPYPRAHTL